MSEVAEVVMAVIALCALGVASLNLSVLRKISSLIEEHKRLRAEQRALRTKVGKLPCVKK